MSVKSSPKTASPRKTKTAPPSVATRAPRGASRQLILDWLAAHGGEIVDKSGRATTLLHDQSDYAGSMGGLAALLQSLDNEGTIVRSVSGRRCTRIALANVPEAVQSTPPAPTVQPKGIGLTTIIPVGETVPQPRYDELAWSLLRTVSKILSEGDSSSAGELKDRLVAAGAALEAAQTRIASLERGMELEIRSVEDEMQAVKVENRGLRERLRRAEDNNSLLMGQLQKRQPAGQDGFKALDKVMREVPSRRG